MQLLLRLLFIIIFSTSWQLAYASRCGQCGKEKNCPQICPPTCCEAMGGVSYCDSSVGRLVCKNGFYSSCYCTRHAIMDLQVIEGCCIWQGGVFQLDEMTGAVICNNGGVSEVCTTNQAISPW